MSEDLDDLVDNLKEPSVWIRILFMLAFGVLLYFVLAPVIFVIMLAQALFVLLTGESNENLRKFSASLSEYINQTLNFLTYNSDDKPFPFADFPGTEQSSAAENTEESSAAAKKKQTSARKKSPGKKRAKKKSEPAASKDEKSSAQ